MIDKQNNSLEDTYEHLSNLIDQSNSTESFDETDFKIEISHLYGHLNRIYHSRNHIGKIEGKEWTQYSKFPTDINPI